MSVVALNAELKSMNSFLTYSKCFDCIDGRGPSVWWITWYHIHCRMYFSISALNKVSSPMWVGCRTWCGSWPAAWGTSLWQGLIQWSNNHSGMLHSNYGGKIDFFFRLLLFESKHFGGFVFIPFFCLWTSHSKYLKLNTLLFSISWTNTDRVTFLYDLLMFNLWAFLYPQVKIIFKTWRLAALPTHID